MAGVQAVRCQTLRVPMPRSEEPPVLVQPIRCWSLRSYLSCNGTVMTVYAVIASPCFDEKRKDEGGGKKKET